MDLRAPFLVVALFLQGASDLPVPPKPPSADKVVATVNGVAIRGGDVEGYLWEWRGREVTRDLINLELITQEAKKQKVAVSKEQVDAEVARQLGLGNPKQIRLEMEQRGYTMSRLYLATKSDMLLSRMAEGNFKPGDYVKISTLIFRPAGDSAAALGAAAQKATAAYDRLKKGESWDAVLRSTTTERPVLDSRGAVGWRMLTQFPESTRKEFASLKEGDSTPPVQIVENGAVKFHIFRLDAKGVGAKGQDLTDLHAYHLQNGRLAILQRIRTEAKVEQFLPAPGG